MVDYAPNLGSTLETRDDAGTDKSSPVRYWLTQLKLSEKQDKDFTEKGRKILRRYRDKRSSGTKGTKRFNILWSNVQTLKPALYARTPKAYVERRFKDEDPIARLGSMILERAIQYELETHDFDGVMNAAVEDRLIVGRGSARVRYVPKYGKPENERIELQPIQDDMAAATGVDEKTDKPRYRNPATGQEVDQESVKQDDQGAFMHGEEFCPCVDESALPEYVFWEDMRFGPCRRWEECPWLGYRAYMTRTQLVERFGKEIGDAVTLDYTPSGLEDSQTEKGGAIPDAFKKAVVWEIWDRGKKETVWISTGYDASPLDTIEDPLEVPDYFPSPRPLTATTTNDQFDPIADYLEYQDQAEELDVLTARIDRLVRACRLAGVYAASERNTLQQLVDESTENKLIPVEDWQTFAQSKGGLTGMIQWIPIKDIAAVLMTLYDSRDKAKQVLYEITGIGDLIRGATSPDETYGAQRLKSQYATMRISDSQKYVSHFARDIIRLMGQIIAQHFSPETLSRITGFPDPMPPQPQPPQQPQMPQAPNIQPGDPQAQQKIQSAAQQVQQQQAQFQQAMQAFQQAMQGWQTEQKRRQDEFMAACQLLRQNAPCPYKIDIEADSTIAPDEDAEKQARTEFLTAMVQLLEIVVPLIMQTPMFAPLAKELVGFAARGFRAGRSLEKAFTDVFDKMEKMPPQKPPGKEDGKKGPSPEEIGVQMQKNQTQQQKNQGELQLKAKKQAFDEWVTKTELALKKREIDRKTAEQMQIHTRELRKLLFGTATDIMALNEAPSEGSA